jgi:type I restriction enzyme S subunit
MHQSGRVVWSPNNTRFLPEKFASIKPDLAIRGRALILNLTAQSLRDEFLGRACITESSEAALLNQRLAWLIPARIDLEYISIVFRSPIFRRFVARLNTGSLIQHMFTWQVDQFQVPVPPLEEQHRIVACVSELLDGADRMTRVAVRSQRKARALRVQLLSDAFSGRLVPQDPMDEPVSVLVARIRAELLARPRSQRRRGMTKLTPQEETLL